MCVIHIGLTIFKPNKSHSHSSWRRPSPSTTTSQLLTSYSTNLRTAVQSLSEWLLVIAFASLLRATLCLAHFLSWPRLPLLLATTGLMTDSDSDLDSGRVAGQWKAITNSNTFWFGKLIVWTNGVRRRALPADRPLADCLASWTTKDWVRELVAEQCLSINIEEKRYRHVEFTVCSLQSQIGLLVFFSRERVVWQTVF